MVKQEIIDIINPENCYQYDIINYKSNVNITFYKSKKYNHPSMPQLMNVYDNIN